MKFKIAKFKITKGALTALLILTSWFSLAQAIDLTLDPSTAKNMTIEARAGGSFLITATTNDPNIDTVSIPADYDHTQHVVLEFEYKSTSGLDDFQAFYRNENQGAAGNRRALFGPIAAASQWTTFTGYLDISGQNWTQAYNIFRLDFGRIPNRSIEVRNFVLRELTAQEIQDRLPKKQVSLELNVNETSPFLTATEFEDGSYKLDTTGGDPWIATITHTSNYEPELTYMMSFEYRSETSYNGLEVFFQRPFSSANKMDLPVLPASTGWKTYVINTKLESDNFSNAVRTDFRIDFGKQEFADKTIFVRNLQIRQPTEQELIDEQNSDLVVSAARNEKLLTHLNTTFDNRITSVVVKPTTIDVVGEVSALGELLLADIVVEQDFFDSPDYTALNPIVNQNGFFTVTVQRYVDTPNGMIDRLYSRFMILEQTADEQYDLVSDPHWATDVAEIAAYNFKESKAETIKGLDGLTARTLSNAQDLVDLGVDSMKVNLILTSIYNANNEGIEHEFNGKTFFMSEQNVRAFDELVKTSNDRNLAVGVVLLIPRNVGSPVKRELFVHPDADRGIYTMANVTNAAGVEAYSATIDFLAKRYSNPNGEFGRIAYWIVHNEVDAHQTWTYAGKKPEALYGDLYQKSMRIVYYTARKYDPSAKVYASYTHHWNKKAGGDNRNFAPKKMLARLEQYSERQGDFEWGIGYHSYPLNLFNPKTWNDAAARTARNLNAEYITPRNLEVIDMYARQFSSLYKGKKVRTVILSENGMSSNANRIPVATQENQAAGIAYFWKKATQGLSSIENIQYHRWVDNPNEGGLEFGLWTNGGENPDDFGEKKLSWYVWEAAGTAQEDSVFDQYLSVINIPDWESIIANVPKQTTPFKVNMALENCAVDSNDLFVSFNGERKRPQEDGTVEFYNVASNVDQPYSIKLGNTLLASDVLDVTENTSLNFDLGIITNLTDIVATSRSITFTWDISSDLVDAYTLYVKNDQGEYEVVQTISDYPRRARHVSLSRGTNYEYMLVPEIDGAVQCPAFIESSTTTRGARRK